MINRILVVIIFVLITNTPAFSEMEDCNIYKIMSKDYLKCQKDNLKHKSEEKGITEGVSNFKSSKTLSEFLKKNKK
tara:strand:+ start:350 stop:577 length:228 start_codon:yes stop_codon:yes gene_type:complete